MADIGKKLDDTCAAFVKQSSTCMPCNTSGQEVVEEFSYKRSIPEAPKDGMSFEDFKDRKKPLENREISNFLKSSQGGSGTVRGHLGVIMRARNEHIVFKDAPEGVQKKG